MSKILKFPMPWMEFGPTFHVLNGDGLNEIFPIKNSAQIIILRECLIEGPLESDHLELFFRLRADYLYSTTAEKSEYTDKVISELNKIQHLPLGADVFLWFEDDLFCQINLWFIVQLLQASGFQGEIHRVFPPGDALENNWRGFGQATAEELTICFQKAVRVSLTEKKMILQLWAALQNQDLTRLAKLALQPLQVVRHLPLLIQAYLDRFASPSRPLKRLSEIQAQGINDFITIYEEFKKTEAIYGFGDAQVKTMLDDINGQPTR